MDIFNTIKQVIQATLARRKRWIVLGVILGAVVFVPLAWVLSQYTPLGAMGPFYAVMIAFSTVALVSGIVFRRGRWKGQTV